MTVAQAQRPYLAPVDAVRPLTPAGRRVLAAASELFYLHGITAVGVDAIARQAGVTKKTIYDCFGSKDDLVVTYLSDRAERWSRAMLATSVDSPPRDRILDTFDVLRMWCRNQDARGCAFVNAAVELPHDHRGHRVVRDQKAWMQEFLRHLAQQAGYHDADGVAKQIAILQDGACVVDALESVDHAVDRAAHMARLVLASAPLRAPAAAS